MKKVTMPQLFPIRFSKKGQRKILATIRKFNKINKAGLNTDDRALAYWLDRATVRISIVFNKTLQKMEVHNSSVELGKALTGHIITECFEFKDFIFECSEISEVA